MKKLLFFTLGFLGMYALCAQRIGIGTNTPLALLHVADSSVIFTATGDIAVSPGNPPIETEGRRLLWYADKAAFRVGYTSSFNNNLWTKNNIGAYSFAAGQLSNASGFAALAIGSGCIASGNYSVALGSSSATATQATALGNSSATGIGAVALGGAQASGMHAVSLGFATTASGNNSVVLGYQSSANGHNSTALGNYVSTSGFSGAFALGDNSTTTVMPSFVNNGFRARFVGGYRLFTTPITTDGTAIGALLNTNQSSWSAISDVHRKENFIDVDGESFLKKIAGMHLTTWNYKGQDVRTLRHYGPMAQDFFASFGRDELGEIGDDTSINQQDFLGVNLIAIQALEKRTASMDEMKNQILALQHANAKLEAELKKLQEALKNK
ncbi:MAG TPA: tail fiber domain-containing protein [Ferruginibacter sp.]|nr:tail fiber domain-containing protein [Ferruginibacter sp.]